MSDFDFEAFIAGSQLAEDTFTVYLVNNGRKIAHLREQIAAAKGGTGDDREATVPADTADLEKQVQALVEQMGKSKREITLRAMDSDEVAKLIDGGTDVYEQISMQAVNPTLTVDQAHRLAKAIGHRQWTELVEFGSRLAAENVVMPDFSPSDSTNPDQRESSVS